MDELTFPLAVEEAWSSGAPAIAARKTSLGSPFCSATLTTNFAPTATAISVRTWVLNPEASTIIS